MLKQQLQIDHASIYHQLYPIDICQQLSLENFGLLKPHDDQYSIKLGYRGFRCYNSMINREDYTNKANLCLIVPIDLASVAQQWPDKQKTIGMYCLPKISRWKHINQRNMINSLPKLPFTNLLMLACNAQLYKNSIIYTEMSQLGLENVQSHSNKTQYMELLSEALDTSHRFHCEKEPFNHTYYYNDMIQKHFTHLSIPTVLQEIKKKYQQADRPLFIADFCCGCGEITSELLKKIEEKGVQVEEMIGYDISQEFLDMSKRFATDKLHFKRCNLEKGFDEVQKFDVMVIFHGLQWMNDLDRAVEAAALSLKPGGLLFTLTYIENKNFYKIRLQFLQNSRWHVCFDPKAFELYPFHFSSEIYLKSFSRFFDCVHQEDKQVEFQFKKSQLARVFESDFQEVRHLQLYEGTELEKQATAESYLSEFVDNLGNIEGCIELKGINLIGYSPVMHFFEGAKKKDES